MSTRLDKKMAELKAAGKKGIFIYITAGAPDVETTLRAVREAEKAGADVIELGLPFSDPMADGPVIQSASVCALKNGMTLKKELEIVREIRKFSEIPLIGMGYINNMYHYGFEKFVTDFKAAGMDGIIVPDVPHEESGEMRKICAAHDFHLAEFITPGRASFTAFRTTVSRVSRRSTTRRSARSARKRANSRTRRWLLASASARRRLLSRLRQRAMLSSSAALSSSASWTASSRRPWR